MIPVKICISISNKDLLIKLLLEVFDGEICSQNSVLWPGIELEITSTNSKNLHQFKIDSDLYDNLEFRIELFNRKQSLKFVVTKSTNTKIISLDGQEVLSVLAM